MAWGLAATSVPTAIWGAIGTDAAGDVLTSHLVGAGVNTNALLRVPGPSPESLILTSSAAADPAHTTGQRAIVGLTDGLLDHLILDSTEATGRDALLNGVGTVVVPSWRPSFTAVLREAHTRGLSTVVGLRALVSIRGLYASMLVGSISELPHTLEARDPDEDLATWLLRTLPARLECPIPVVVTDAHRGSCALIADPNGWHALSVPALRLPAPARGDLDVVGAGDAYLAGLLIALHQQRPWPHALRVAAAWGTATVASARSHPKPPHPKLVAAAEHLSITHSTPTQQK